MLESSEMSALMLESSEMSALAEEAHGLANKKADFVQKLDLVPGFVVKSSSDEYIKGFMDCRAQHDNSKVYRFRFHYSASFMMVVATDVDSMARFLQASIEESHARQKATPAKVLTKSVAIRIAKVAAKLAAVVKNAQTQVKAAGQSPNWYYQQTINDYSVDFATISRANLTEFLVKHTTSRRGLFLRETKDLLKFLQRPEVTDEMVRDACNMVVAKEIIDS